MSDHPPSHRSVTRVPTSLVSALGYGGLVPFCLLALAACWPGGRNQAFFGFALLAYGASIASFLGAIHWGMAMRDGAGRRVAYLWGVTPSLVAWTSLLLPTPWGLVLLAGLLLLCFGVDWQRYRLHQLQGWLPMRLRLTAVACISCLAAAWSMVR